MLARPVDRDPDEEVVLLEELRPLLVEQRGVRLDRVLGLLARACRYRVGELDRAAEELDAHQRRLAALPGDRHLGHARVRLDQLPDVRLEQLVGHAEPRARVEHLLREEEAVRAVEVADRARRLRQQVERAGRVGHGRDRAHRLSQVVASASTRSSSTSLIAESIMRSKRYAGGGFPTSAKEGDMSGALLPGGVSLQSTGSKGSSVR